MTHPENTGNRNWLILAIALIGSFMAVLDTTIAPTWPETGCSR